MANNKSMKFGDHLITEIRRIDMSMPIQSLPGNVWIRSLMLVLVDVALSLTNGMKSFTPMVQFEC